jgi:hypothetical protein
MGDGSHPLLWTCYQAARGKITISDKPNRLNYCVIFKVYTQITNETAGWKLMLYGKPRLMVG